MGGRLQNKVALVTGGNMGIGQAVAELMAREGAKVVISARGEDLGRKVVEGIRKSGGEAVFVKCDVTQPDQVEALIASTVSTYGRLDCAINNAGYEGKRHRLADLPEDVWDGVMDVNLTGVWLCMKYEIPQMLKQGGGIIVNMSSTSGLVGPPTFGAYGTSKWALNGLTQSAALEYADKGIRINALCPAGTTTAMLDRIMSTSPIERAAVNERRPIGREATLDEMAEPTVWLCTDAASYVNGHIMPVDGAQTVA
ncbi:MAG: glucose 1-dehydrogenase [Chloroflexi bacterium]|nr:glucose 1-dehydrogenase [Chloroflexota bacterium]